MIHAACAAFARALADGGVREVCVSPGSRSTPLALAVSAEPGLRTRVHLDERSAAFFALGLAKASRRPVALLCTSGTAAAEYLPAVVEASFARVPLVVLTADRPPELRDAGAGQTIDQPRLYGSHARWFHELDGPPETGRFAWIAARAAATAVASPPGPVHVNIPFRDPLVPDAPAAPDPGGRVTVHTATPAAPDRASLARLATDLARVERGLVVCGPIDGDATFAAEILRLAARLGWPLLADGASQLRGIPDARVVVAYDALLRSRAFLDGHVPEAVVRFGGTPISKALGDLLAHAGVRRSVLVDPDAGWNDPAHRVTDVIHADETATCAALADALPPSGETPWSRGWLAADAAARAAIAAELDASAALFEGRVPPELARVLPDGAALYVGNSMPIRDLDSFLPAGGPRLRVLVNRGANGIDGLLSSGLGAAAGSDGPVVIVVGDLALQHDLGGLAAIRAQGVATTVVVLNNDGGGIFSFLPQARLPHERFEQLFGTPQGLDVAAAAALFGLAHVRIGSWMELRDAVRASVGSPRTTIIEVPTERRENVLRHEAIWTRVSSAITKEVA